MSQANNPLLGAIPAEVPLVNAPLVRVIAQVRFSEVMLVEDRPFIAPFQEALRGAYPVLQQEQAAGLHLGPQGLMPAMRQTVWRFGDETGAWRVSLSTMFIALETTTYTSRGDFLHRLRFVIEALQAHIKPNLVERLGIRYIDRLVGNDLSALGALVRPELLGLMTTVVAGHAQHALTDMLFDLPSGQLRLRSGILPANAVIDQAAIEPVADRSWVLDLDMSNTTRTKFRVDELMAEAEAFASRIYGVFRWAVTDSFLTRYGGKL